MNADSAIDMLARMREELSTLGSVTTLENERLCNAREGLMHTFSCLVDLLRHLIGEKESTENTMHASNSIIAGIASQNSSLRDMRDSGDQQIGRWSDIAGRVREQSWSLSAMFEASDLSQQELWNALSVLRDNLYRMAVCSDKDMGIEELFSQERENFEALRVEAERLSDRVVISALRMNLKSKIEVQTDKMLDELEEWRHEHIDAVELKSRETRSVTRIRTADKQVR